MTFDTRARGAAQGIHRAVEVMERSDTEAPERIARFDRYRDRTSRNSWARRQVEDANFITAQLNARITSFTARDHPVRHSATVFK